MVYSTHLTNEAMPEPGTLLRVVSVHPSNRTFETIPVGHEPGWLVSDPAGTNSLYWTDGEVSEEHPGWVRHQSGVPAAVISRHGAQPEPEPSVPSPRPRRRRGSLSPREQAMVDAGGDVDAVLAETRGRGPGLVSPLLEPATVATGDAVNVDFEASEEGNGDT